MSDHKKVFFIASDFAQKFFNIAAGVYSGESVTDLLQEVLGPDNYDKYLYAQAVPSYNSKKGDKIFMCLNKEVLDPKNLEESYKNLNHKKLGMLYTR